MACSDLTASMAGPPDFAEAPVTTWEEFCEDYEPYFFDGSHPERGRSFIIERIPGCEAVGHVSYSRMDEDFPPLVLRPFAELDIWMRDSSCCGHGYGSEALRLLCEHLHCTLGIREMILRPSARNARAMRSYVNAGFLPLDLSQNQQMQRYGRGEYHDTVVLRRLFE